MNSAYPVVRSIYRYMENSFHRRNSFFFNSIGLPSFLPSVLCSASMVMVAWKSDIKSGYETLRSFRRSHVQSHSVVTNPKKPTNGSALPLARSWASATTPRASEQLTNTAEQTNKASFFALKILNRKDATANFYRGFLFWGPNWNVELMASDCALFPLRSIQIHSW